MERIDLNDWHEIKQNIKRLEKRSERYRRIIEKYMTDKGLRKLTQNDHTVSLQSRTTSSISRKDIPSDVWEKYCKTSQYNVLTLK